jgi:hypothetical protein
MSTKKREVIFGGRIMGAKIRAEHARELAKKAQRDADRAEAELWSIRMEAYGGPAQPTIIQCLNGGLGWLEVECNRCETCCSCRKGRYAPPVHMIRLTETREIAPHPWVHPDEER